MRDAQRRALEDRLRRDVSEGVLPGGTAAAVLARFTSAVLQGLSVQALDGASADELLAVADMTLNRWAVSEATT